MKPNLRSQSTCWTSLATPSTICGVTYLPVRLCQLHSPGRQDIRAGGRISALHQIQEAEKFLDTIIFGSAQTDTTCARVPDASAPSLPAAEAASPPEPATTHCPDADAPPPVIVPGDSWTRLGVRPKALVNSTPSHQEPWSLVGARGRRGGTSLMHPRNTTSSWRINTTSWTFMTSFLWLWSRL